MSDNSPKLIGQLQTQTLNLERGLMNVFKRSLCIQLHIKRTKFGASRYNITLQSNFSFSSMQVLPLVTETVRWFDMDPLMNLWNKNLTRDNTLLCYGSCIALRYSITHAGRLMHFLEQPPSTWKVKLHFPLSFGRL